MVMDEVHTETFAYRISEGDLIRTPYTVAKYHRTERLKLPRDQEQIKCISATLYEVFVATEYELWRIFDERLFFEGKAQEVKEIALPEDCVVKRISGGGVHLLLLDASGRVWSYGHGTHGELGLGHVLSATVPSLIEGLGGITDIKASVFHSAAVDEYGQLFVWGWNESGQLGGDKAPIEWEPAQVELAGKCTGVKLESTRTVATVNVNNKVANVMFGK